MILTIRLALFCLIMNMAFSLCAQSSPPGSRHWQMSVGAQYTQGRATNSFSAQPLEAFSYGGNMEYVLTLPKLTMTFFMYAGFQQLRAEGRDIVAPAFFNFEEVLRIDNLIFGPGLELKLNNQGKYHPLIGAQAFWGGAVNSEYRFDNNGMALFLTEPLPNFYEVKGGAGTYTSGQIFAGFERVFTEKIQLRIKGALGGHYQYASWELPFPFESSEKAQLVKGGYWQASMEVIHRL